MGGAGRIYEVEICGNIIANTVASGRPTECNNNRNLAALSFAALAGCARRPNCLALNSVLWNCICARSRKRDEYRYANRECEIEYVT